MNRDFADRLRRRLSAVPPAWLAGSAAVAVLLLALLVFVRPRPRPPAPGSPEGVPATVTVDEVAVRKAPAPDAAELARWRRGARVEARRDVGVWTEVRSGDIAGYVPSEAIEREPDREARERRAGTILKFTPVAGVLAEDAEVRLAPFPMAARAGKLEKGETVRLYAVDHAYFALKDANGGVVFVDSKSVDLIPPDPRAPAITPARDRAPKNVEVTELAQPLPLPAGEEPPPEEGGAPAPPEAPAPPAVAVPGEPVLEPAALLAKTDPVYPEGARRMGVEGTVVLEATIGADGAVTDVRVVKSLPYGLSEAAAAAVRRWRYRPARGRAGPVASRKEVRIEFRLRS
jgi:TonB family protein